MDVNSNDVLDPSQTSWNGTPGYVYPFFQLECPQGTLDSTFDLDWDLLLGPPGWVQPSIQTLDVPIRAGGAESAQAADESTMQYSAGLHLHQVDGVEAKCIEIRHLLQSIQTGIPIEPVLQYVTRDRLVNCIQLYAKHYQPVQPLLHLPTFDLTMTETSLLSAIMLVGACYSNNDIPAAIVVQGAIQLLHVMETSPVCMTRPCPLDITNGHCLSTRDL